MAGGDNINYEVSGAGDDLISVGGTMTLGTVATNLNFGVWGTWPCLGITRLPGRGRLWLAWSEHRQPDQVQRRCDHYTWGGRQN